MSGRYEKEKRIDNNIMNKLQRYPQILTDYYYNIIGSGKSYMTARNYINNVILFIGYMYKGNCPEDFYKHITTNDINRYIASLRTKEVRGEIERTSDSYKTSNWTTLNSFFEFLVPEYTTNNPMEFTKRPKMKDNSSVTYLNPEEVNSVLKNVQNLAQKKFVNRDLCIMKLGFTTGLRVSEIVQIDMNDLDMANNTIRITGKGDYDGCVFIGENLKKQLIEWIRDREIYFEIEDTNALFVSQKKTRLSTDMVGKMMTKYTKGITDKHVTPHVMRHSCATNLYEKTGDIYLCSSQLRHKNVSTTQRYAELSQAKRIKATAILDDMI